MSLSIRDAEQRRPQALYERIGFRFEGTRRRAYVIRGGAIDDPMMAYVFDGR